MCIFYFFIGLYVHYTFIDQVYFADPAINYVLTGEYRSTAWGVVNENLPHVSNAPLYSFLLIIWFKIFDFGSITMRVLPSLLSVLSALFLWLACQRLSIVKTPLVGAMLILVFLMDFGFAHSYTCGRPDALSALIAAGLFYLYSLPRSFFKNVFVFVLSAVIPFTQYGLAIYVLALVVPLVLIYQKNILPFAALVLCSMIAGFLFQFIFYQDLGIWQLWIQMIRSEGSENILQRIFSKLTTNPLEIHNNTIPKDFSAAVLFAGISLIVLMNLALKSTQINAVLLIGLTIAVWVGIVMYLVGKFPTYYGWMLAMPLSVTLAAYTERELLIARKQIWMPVCVALSAVILGLPMQSALASFDWSDRGPHQFDAWLKDQISEKDVVYCEYPFYFSVKKIAKKTYVGRYWEVMNDEEKSKLSVVILGSTYSEFKEKETVSQEAIATADWIPSKGALMGNNYHIGILSAPNYQCHLYRLKQPHP